MYDSTSVTADKNGLKDYSTCVCSITPPHTHTQTHFPHHSLYNWATLKPTKVPSSLTHIHLRIFHLRTPISFPPLSSFLVSVSIHAVNNKLVCVAFFSSLFSSLSISLSFNPPSPLSLSPLKFSLSFPCFFSSAHVWQVMRLTTKESRELLHTRLSHVACRVFDLPQPKRDKRWKLHLI